MVHKLYDNQIWGDASFLLYPFQPLCVEVCPHPSLRITSGPSCLRKSGRLSIEKKIWLKDAFKQRGERRRTDLAACKWVKVMIWLTASKLGACICARLIFITASVLIVNTDGGRIALLSRHPIHYWKKKTKHLSNTVCAYHFSDGLFFEVWAYRCTCPKWQFCHLAGLWNCVTDNAIF